MIAKPKFDRDFCYSGFDQRLFAELLPAQLGYWFITILGNRYLVTSDISIPDNRILLFLQTHKFKFDLATWQYEKSRAYTSNPFVAHTPPSIAIALSQSGVPALPQSLQSSSIKIFTQNQSLKPQTAYIYFIATEDYQYLKIGFSKNPTSRLSELQASRPQRLLYLGSFSSTSERFENICSKFEHLLVRNGWYNFTPKLQENVNNLLSQK